jgi:hypothetical protein
MSCGVVECAAARYQMQGRAPGVAVNDFRRKVYFRVLANASNAENSGDPIGQLHDDPVPRAQCPQPVEDSRPLIAVDVALDDRRPDQG